MKVHITEFEFGSAVRITIGRDFLRLQEGDLVETFPLITFRQVSMLVAGDIFDLWLYNQDGSSKLVYRHKLLGLEKEPLSAFLRDFYYHVMQLDKELENSLANLLLTRRAAYVRDRVKNLGCVIFHDREGKAEWGHLVIYDNHHLAFISYLKESRLIKLEAKYYGLEYEVNMAWDQNTPFPGTLLIDQDLAFSAFPETMEELKFFYEAHNRRHHMQGVQSGRGSIVDVDLMEDPEFESFIISLFFKKGYKASLTKAAKETGVSLIAEKDNTRIGILARCNAANINHCDVQQLIEGLKTYSLAKGMIITNMHFTPQALDAAERAGIVLWNRDVLREKIYELGT